MSVALQTHTYSFKNSLSFDWRGSCLEMILENLVLKPCSQRSLPRAGATASRPRKLAMLKRVEQRKFCPGPPPLPIPPSRPPPLSSCPKRPDCASVLCHLLQTTRDPRWPPRHRPHHPSWRHVVIIFHSKRRTAAYVV